MKANRIILTQRVDGSGRVYQFTAKNFHMDGRFVTFTSLPDNAEHMISLKVIERIDVFHINVDPITYEPVISSSNESA